MADGSWKRIEDIKVGDKVLSRNVKTGKTEPKTVTDTIVHHRIRTLVLAFADGNKIETTAIHPFYVSGMGFVEAGKLKIGEKIVSEKAGPIKLDSARYTGARKTVYNIEVADDHTYFVGKIDGGVWVHNNLDCDEPEPELEGATQRTFQQQQKWWEAQLRRFNLTRQEGNILEKQGMTPRFGYTDQEIMDEMQALAEQLGKGAPRW